MELSTWVQFLNKAVCISYRANTYEKDKNSSYEKVVD